MNDSRICTSICLVLIFVLVFNPGPESSTGLITEMETVRTVIEYNVVLCLLWLT